MRNAQCRHCLSDCDHVTYFPKVTSAEFRSKNKTSLQIRLNGVLTFLKFSCVTNVLLHSSCDSRNLNLSPFCNLNLTSLAMWQPSILETYGNRTTSYVNQRTGPLRLKYPNSMGDRELISSLTKVRWSKTYQIQSDSSGPSVLQRL